MTVPISARTSAAMPPATTADDESALRLLLQRQPDRFDALHRLGILQAARHCYADAIGLLQRAVAALPGQALAHYDLAQALRGLGRNVEAATQFERAANLAPGNTQLRLVAMLHRATLHDEQGDDLQARLLLEEACRQFPESADAWAGLGMVQLHSVGPEAAEASFQRALQIDPDRPEVVEKFGQVLQDQRRYEDAAIVFERVMQRWPGRPLTAGRLMHNKMLMADWLAVDRLQAHIEADIAAGRPGSEPFGLQGYCGSPALLGQAARTHAATFFPDRSAMLAPPRVGRGPKIRIGYVSGEFRNQATSVLLTQVLELHDRARFEVLAFDNGWDDRSPLRRRIEAAVEIVPIHEIANLPAAKLVRQRGIDVLVNLNGYFGRARTPLFSLRAAPVQVNYLGFPGTMGAPYMDYIIADEVVIPEASRPHYAEQVVYLPDCYQPNDARRQIAGGVSRADAGLPAQGFVFCCMNNTYKIMPAVFDVWMRLLQRVPGSVLMLLADQPESRANLAHEAQARGVDPARIRFGEPWANERHLARLRVCDLFLDTLPYNAHTTGTDALWAGLPLLTCTGDNFPSRVGASLLRAVGLPELVTATLPDYEALALRLATEPGLLAGLRARLAAQRSTAPLYDTPRYTRHLEAAYTGMVERARAGKPPRSFRVAGSA